MRLSDQSTAPRANQSNEEKPEGAAIAVGLPPS